MKIPLSKNYSFNIKLKLNKLLKKSKIFVVENFKKVKILFSYCVKLTF